MSRWTVRLQKLSGERTVRGITPHELRNTLRDIKEIHGEDVRVSCPSSLSTVPWLVHAALHGDTPMEDITNFTLTSTHDFYIKEKS